MELQKNSELSSSGAATSTRTAAALRQRPARRAPATGQATSGSDTHLIATLTPSSAALQAQPGRSHGPSRPSDTSQEATSGSRKTLSKWAPPLKETITKRIPGVEGGAAAAEDRRQHPGHPQVGRHEGRLEEQHPRPRRSQRPEQQLHQRRVDRRGAGVVDLLPPRGPQRGSVRPHQEGDGRG